MDIEIIGQFACALKLKHELAKNLSKTCRTYTLRFQVCRLRSAGNVNCNLSNAKTIQKQIWLAKSQG